MRGNRFQNIQNIPLGGNNHATFLPTSGEYLFNLVRNPNYALRVNNDGQASAIWIYRNTFVGNVVVASTDNADGPFTFSNNVIVNGEATGIDFESVSAPTRIVSTNNLVAGPSGGLVDSLGNLTGANTRFIGTHGHQKGPAGQRPNPPTGMTAQ